MLIKEYRIPIPLSVDDYQIAQLYMIQKKSREESEGEGSAVEILENHPYEDGPNGSGQYTYKVYHIGRHLPNWFRNIAPKTALEVHEESWNAYPYTKTIFSVPFVDKFSIDIETYFERDGGTQENKFKLKPSEIRQRELDVIDIVNDQLTGSDYIMEEDPAIYASQKHGRGPLKPDWIKNPPDGVIMCAYKLVKVEFRYWGLQSKVERFIHDYGLRRVMLRAHRQAWAWQDEWVGLTIEDIRVLERETQLILQKKLGRTSQEEREEEEEEVIDGGKKAIEGGGVVQSSPGGSDHDLNTPVPTTPSSAIATPTSATPSSSTPSSHRKESLRKSMTGQSLFERRSSNRWRKGSIHSSCSRKTSNTSSLGSETLPRINNITDPSAHRSNESDEESLRPEWALDQIELEDSDSDLEFFDAQDTIYGEEEDSLDEEDERDLVEVEESQSVKLDTTSVESTGTGRATLWRSSKAFSMDVTGDEEALRMLDTAPSPSPDILFLILHGGSIMDPVSDRVGKTLDFSTLQTNIRTVTELHFRSAIDRIAMRMVPCKNICNLALQTLCGVSPVPITPQEWSEGLLPTLETQHSQLPGHLNSAGASGSGAGTPVLPVGTIPLLATQCHTYQNVLKRVAEGANKVYREFLQSEEGANFNGQVCVIGDCMGAVIGYDILISTTTSFSRGSPSTPPRIPSPQPSPPPPHRKTSAIVPPSNYTDRRQTTPMKMKQFISSTIIPADKQGTTASLPSQNLSLKLNLNQREPSMSSLGSDHSSNTSINVGGGEESSFCFDVNHFFAFGSPLGLILAQRKSKSKKTASNPPPRPSCTFFYNLFYGVDQIASRIEPLLDGRFSNITPIRVPNYKAFPTGSNEPYTLKDTVVQHPFLFVDQRLPVSEEGERVRRKAISSECLLSLNDDTPYDTIDEIKPFSVWWSEHRIDYMLETPWKNEGFERLPVSTFSHIVHSSYWEAKEMASFILRQVLHHDVVCVKQRINGRETIQVPFIPRESVVKWRKKRTSMRISRLRSNHRATDVVALEGVTLPPIPAKFQYGPLAMASLSKEEVEVYKFTQRPTPKWEYVDCQLTDKHGKFMFTFPGNKSLPPGLYPIKFLVKGDHTNASCNLFVVPSHVEAVVFSIDGALASNFSLSAKDMKLKQGSVEVARSWQELGYLIIYISGRPDLQKDCILNFLGCHGFPLGLVSCADSFSTDSNSVKTAYLGRLIKQAKIIIHAGYGSSRHIGFYKELGLQSDQIYIHGKKTKTRRSSSEEYQVLIDGFAEHYHDLLADPPRKAMHDVTEWFGDTCFALPGNRITGNQKKSRHLKRSAFKSQQSVSIDSTQNGNRLLTPKGRHYLEVNHQTDV